MYVNVDNVYNCRSNTMLTWEQYNSTYTGCQENRDSAEPLGLKEINNSIFLMDVINIKHAIKKNCHFNCFNKFSLFSMFVAYIDILLVSVSMSRYIS